MTTSSENKTGKADVKTLEGLLKKYDLNPSVSSDCPDGWLPIADRLFARLVEAGWDRRLGQIKEKFGGLRVYLDSHDDRWSEAIREAEAESFKTCQTCGEPGRRRGVGGWLMTSCEACWREAGRA